MEMKEFVKQLVDEYNSYSELVALNYRHIEEGRGDREILQWNRGHLYCIEKHIEALIHHTGLSLRNECREHVFDTGKKRFNLEYRTIRIVE